MAPRPDAPRIDLAGEEQTGHEYAEKALRRLPGLSTEVDLDALESFLAFNAIHGPRTIFREVRKLPPGHVLVREADAGERQRGDQGLSGGADHAGGRGVLPHEGGGAGVHGGEELLVLEPAGDPGQRGPHGVAGRQERLEHKIRGQA